MYKLITLYQVTSDIAGALKLLARGKFVPDCGVDRMYDELTFLKD